MDPFISRADLGAYLRRNLSADDMATIAVDAACDSIRTMTGQVLDLVTDEVVELDGPDADTLLLPQLPVISVSDVSMSGVSFDSLTDYWVDKRLGALVTKRYGRRWLKGRRIYTVTYTHGWAEIPADLRILALTAAARIYDQGLVSAESVGGYSVTFAAPESLGFSDRERQIIAKYSDQRT